MRISSPSRRHVKSANPVDFASLRIAINHSNGQNARLARNVCGSCVSVCVLIGLFWPNKALLHSPKRIHLSLVCVLFGPSTIVHTWNTTQREAATHASLSSALLRSIFLSVQIALPRRRDTPTTCAPDPLHPSLVTAGTSHTPTLSIIRSPRAFGTWALDFGGVWFFTVFGTRCRENDCGNLFALVITESWACILHEAKAYPMFLINMHTTRVTFAKFDSGGGFDTLFAMFYYPLCQFLL